MTTYEVYGDASHRPYSTTAYWATVVVGHNGWPKIEAGQAPRDPALITYGIPVAELYAIWMGLHWCRVNGATVNLYTDSEAALHWLKHKPTELSIVRRIISRVADRQLAITYHQIPAHSNIYHAYAHHACDRLRRGLRVEAFDRFRRFRLDGILGSI